MFMLKFLEAQFRVKHVAATFLWLRRLILDVSLSHSVDATVN